MRKDKFDNSFPRDLIMLVDSNEDNYASNLILFNKTYRTALSFGMSESEAARVALERLKKLLEKRDRINNLQEVILAIDSDKSNLLNNRTYFHFIYNKALKSGMSSDEAYNFSLDKIKQLVEKRKLSTPVYQKKEKSYNNDILMEEDIAFKKKIKDDYKKSIIEKISLGTGETNIDKLEELFKIFRTKNRTANDIVSLRRVIKLYNSNKEPELPKVYSEEELKHYYNIVGLLKGDRSDNIRLFEIYLKSLSPELALDRLKLNISAKDYMMERGIPIDNLSVKIFMQSRGNFELAEEQLREREAEGKLGLDVSTLGVNKDNEPLINYNGSKISLGRIVNYVYSNETIRIKKYAYSTLKHYIFELRMSVDDAIARINKTIRFFEFKSSLEKMFPEDPETAKSIFSGYYLDDDLSFDDALRATKEELETNPSN